MSVFDWKTWYGIHCVVNVVFVLCNKYVVDLSDLDEMLVFVVLFELRTQDSRYYGSIVIVLLIL